MTAVSDAEAIERFLHRFRGMAFRVALRIVHDRDLAEDVAQEATLVGPSVGLLLTLSYGWAIVRCLKDVAVL